MSDLARSEFLAAVIEHLPAAVVVMDLTGRPVLVNAACRRMLGQDLDHRRTIDQQSDAFVPRSTGSLAPVPVRSLMDQVLSGESYDVAVTVRLPSTRTELALRVVGEPLRMGTPGIVGAVIVLHDVTAERATMRELAWTAHRLEQLLSGAARPALPEGGMPASPLTARELEVLRHLADARSNLEIAQALGLSVGTVRLHVKHILAKLGVRNRTHAARYAWQLSAQK